MPNYKKMYVSLFNAITDAIDILQKAQQDTEDSYISTVPPDIRVLDMTQAIAPNEE